MKNPIYYSIRKGLKTGIFNDWEEVKNYVLGVPNVEYKKFNSYEKAKNYLNYNIKQSNILSYFSKEKSEDKSEGTFEEKSEGKSEGKSEDPNENIFNNEFLYEKPYIKVYTDGSCLNNGKNKKRGAGYAIIFPPPYGKYCKSEQFDIGERTNNRAEIYAIIETFRIIKEIDPDGVEIFLINTDSKYSMTCIKGVNKWKKNNWKNSYNSEYFKNIDMLEILYTELKELKSTIKFKHVRAHQTDQSEDTLYNSIADKYAKEKAIAQISQK